MTPVVQQAGDFAKLFRIEPFGQVLCVADVNDDSRPEVRWSITPPDLGVCSISLGFEDTDKGWDARDVYFQKADEATANAAAIAIMKSIGG